MEKVDGAVFTIREADLKTYKDKGLHEKDDQYEEYLCRKVHENTFKNIQKKYLTSAEISEIEKEKADLKKRSLKDYKQMLAKRTIINIAAAQVMLTLGMLVTRHSNVIAQAKQNIQDGTSGVIYELVDGDDSYNKAAKIIGQDNANMINKAFGNAQDIVVSDDSLDKAIDVIGKENSAKLRYDVDQQLNAAASGSINVTGVVDDLLDSVKSQISSAIQK